MPSRGSPTESVWKTAFGAAKIAVNAAKNSSDILTPVIAVLGALSVLINNYDVGAPQTSFPLH